MTAEERERVKTDRRHLKVLRGVIYSISVLFLLGTVSAFVALARIEGVIHERVSERKRVTTEICQGQNELRTTLRSLLTQSLRVLPTQAYYKEHPEELSRAQHRTETAIEQLHNLECDLINDGEVNK